MESIVEWFADKLRIEHGLQIDLYNELNEAKEMERQQRISDFKAGCNACGFEYSADDWAKEYFQNKLKSK